jgi:hypothetical protein
MLLFFEKYQTNTFSRWCSSFQEVGVDFSIDLRVQNSRLQTSNNIRTKPNPAFGEKYRRPSVAARVKGKNERS